MDGFRFDLASALTRGGDGKAGPRRGYGFRGLGLRGLRVTGFRV